MLSDLARQNRFDVCGVTTGAYCELHCYTKTLFEELLSVVVFCTPFSSIESILKKNRPEHLSFRCKPHRDTIGVAATSKAWVYGCSLAGNAGSNPAVGYGCLSLVSVVCC